MIYTKLGDLNNSAFGKFETPIKMVIEHQSDFLSKKGGIRDWLFNVEKSNKFGETIVSQNDFNIFTATTEGSGAENDIINDSPYKFIEHIQFMKEFVISAEMMEDATGGLPVDAKRRAESFTRAYYKTMNRICEQALINGARCTFEFAGATVDISAPDEEPLFSRNHIYGSSNCDGGYQSNYYYGDIFKTGSDSSRAYSAEQFENALFNLSTKFRNLKDDNGDPLGYTPDTIIIPSNKYKLESMVKKMCGSYGTIGNANNDINIHYGNWNVIVLPGWNSTDDRMMLMSSEANKNLAGNMFFNRIPLTISNWVDHHTGNYHWSGRCRFGVGFGSYRHIMLAVDTEGSSDYASRLED